MANLGKEVILGGNIAPWFGMLLPIALDSPITGHPPEFSLEKA